MSYSFYMNKTCEFYPCHQGLEELNCLFCFCPLYKEECPGVYSFTSAGIKDCSDCSWPHHSGNYDRIIERLIYGESSC